ncbi:MAG: hypothetical protein ACTHKM_12975 [Tsuneonella sp.]
MARAAKAAAKGRFGATLLVGAAMALAIPSAGFALTRLDMPAPEAISAGFAQFTPASVDPVLARKVAQKIAARGQALRFTPAAATTARDRTYTVAVRVDDETARAISFRTAAAAVQGEPGIAAGTVSVAPTRYNLGISRGYQSFAKPETSAAPKFDVGKLEMPDLASFKPREATSGKPSRFEARIALEQQAQVGRAARTLEGAGEQSVDVGGAYRLTRNLNVTAGVRLSQERDRIAPLTDAEQDNQAVYVGTQFKF